MSGFCVAILGSVAFAAVGMTAGFDKETMARNPVMMSVIFGVFALVFYLFALLVPVPYAISRTQNLVWRNTRCDELRFDSQLQFGALTGLTLKNWALMALTLGLYFPFASIAFYRMRVEAMTPQLVGDLDRLQAQAAAAGDASGDAAGDFFGIDIGL